MATSTTATTACAASVGGRRELGRYTVAEGDRIIYGQRILGHVRLVDAPAIAGAGRSWIIESNLEAEGMAAITALVADYLDQAQRHHTIPAGPGAVVSFITALAELDLTHPA